MWLAKHQRIYGGNQMWLRYTCWKYSLLTGVGRAMFFRDKTWDLWPFFEIVEKYFVSVLKEAESISLSLINTETKEKRFVLFNETPPLRQLQRGQGWFDGVMFFLDCVVLFAFEIGSSPHRLWAYKYVPDPRNPSIWTLSSTTNVDVPSPDVHFKLHRWNKVGKHSFALTVEFDNVEEEFGLFTYIYNSKRESWSRILFQDLTSAYSTENKQSSGCATFLAFVESWRAVERGLFRFCGLLCSKVKREASQCLEGTVFSAPRGFAPQNLVKDGREEEEEVDGSPALFLSPGNNPPTLHTLAFRCLVENHPRLLEESHQTLRDIGIPPNMASEVEEHQSWGSNETNVIEVGR